MVLPPTAPTMKERMSAVEVASNVIEKQIHVMTNMLMNDPNNTHVRQLLAQKQNELLITLEKQKNAAMELYEGSSVTSSITPTTGSARASSVNETTSSGGTTHRNINFNSPSMDDNNYAEIVDFASDDVIHSWIIVMFSNIVSCNG